MDATGVLAAGAFDAVLGALSQITISAGQVSGSTTVSIDPTDDTLDESDGTPQRPHETIVFAATANNEDITTVNTASVAIVDDDTLVKTVTLSVDPDSIREDGSATDFTVTATLGGTATSTSDITVALTWAGTATGGRHRLHRHAAHQRDDPRGVGQRLHRRSSRSPPPRTPTSEVTETITVAGTLDGFTVTGATINLIDDDLPVITLGLGTTSAGEDADSTSVVTVTASRVTSDQLRCGDGGVVFGRHGYVGGGQGLHVLADDAAVDHDPVRFRQCHRHGQHRPAGGHRR